jgi:NAD(P)-dependent dehydrogenase (short-subunit alcohol dehydrogenase family)
MTTANDISLPDTLLQGRTILITGAGDGIGRAVAESAAAHGARVILVGRTLEKLEAAYDSIVGADHIEPVIHPMDLAKADTGDYEALANGILDQFSCLDGLLHNASLLGTLNPMQFTEPRQWMELMQVNVNACFLLTRALMPALLASPDARLLFTSSSVGHKARAYWGGYAVSKFAVEGMMQVYAAELEKTSAIRVNSINPGATRTSMRLAAYPAEDPATLPTPESLTPAYLYLLGPDSHSLHGQALNIRDLLSATAG